MVADRHVTDAIQLREIGELSHIALDAHHLARAHIDTEAIVADKDGLRSREVGIGISVLFLEEETTEFGGCVLEVADDHAFNHVGVAYFRAACAITLDVVDEGGRIAAVAKSVAVRRVGAQSAEGVLGKTVPLERWIKGIGFVGIALANRSLAPQGVILGGLIATAPFTAWVVADLSNDINNGAALLQDNSIIAIEKTGGGRLICFGQDGGGCPIISDDIDIAIGNRISQRNGRTG